MPCLPAASSAWIGTGAASFAIVIGALGKLHEWETHCRGALRNGCSVEEIRAACHVIGIYCGVPQALECFRAAKKVLSERVSG